MTLLDDVGALESERATAAGKRYEGRVIVDVARALLEPREPLRMRCHDFVVDGTLTLLSGGGGDGKSALMLALADAVSRGTGAAAGMACVPGTAVIFDAEMGERLHLDRVGAFDIGRRVVYVDAVGLDLADPADLLWCKAQIVEHVDPEVGGLVGFDSLRRLFPSARENDSDDMGKGVASLAQLARETSAGVLLIHHEGWNTGRSRGSRAADDQADLTFSLARTEGAMRKLTCNKPRMIAMPEPRFMSFAMPGGFTSADTPVAPRERHREAILACLPQSSIRAAAEACGSSIGTKAWKEPWDALLTDGRIALHDGAYRVVAERNEQASTTPTF